MASLEALEQSTAAGEWTVPVTVFALATANPGRADDLAKAMIEVRDYAVGAPDDPSKKQEAGTLEYRITRYGDEFAVFERYENVAAVQVHRQGPIAKLKASGIVAKLEIKYYQEF